MSFSLTTITLPGFQWHKWVPTPKSVNPVDLKEQLLQVTCMVTYHNKKGCYKVSYSLASLPLFCPQLSMLTFIGHSYAYLCSNFLIQVSQDGTRRSSVLQREVQCCWACNYSLAVGEEAIVLYKTGPDAKGSVTWYP